MSVLIHTCYLIGEEFGAREPVTHGLSLFKNNLTHSVSCMARYSFLVLYRKWTYFQKLFDSFESTCSLPLIEINDLKIQATLMTLNTNGKTTP